MAAGASTAVRVHRTALVHPGAALAPGVRIGPFCVVGRNAVLDQGAQLQSHVRVTGHTRVGPGCVVHAFSVLGSWPQDLKYAGEPGRLDIGAGSVIREGVSINVGTQGGGMETLLGERCLVMAGAHIAHDCRIGDRVVVANNTALGGHVVVEDRAIVGGQVGVRQRVRIGRLAMVGGSSAVHRDVLPFSLAVGNRAVLRGLNLVGLRRAGTSRGEIAQLRMALGSLMMDPALRASTTLQQRVTLLLQSFQLRGITPYSSVRDLLLFIRRGRPLVCAV